MNVYRKQQYTSVKIKRNKSTQCLTIEQRLRDMKATGEPITDRAKIIYTERRDGIIPKYDIRTDKFDEMIEQTNKAAELVRDMRGTDKVQFEKKKAQKKSENGGEETKIE